MTIIIELARDALTAIQATPIRLLPTADYVTAAQAIAFDLDQRPTTASIWRRLWPSGRT